MTRFDRRILQVFGIVAIALPVCAGNSLVAQGGSFTPATVITGHVKDRAGAPAAGATVHVSAYSTLRNTQETTTGADGAFSVTMAHDTASRFDITVSGTSWIPGYTACRRTATAMAATCDLVVRATTPVFTAAPNEARPVVVERGRLGAADAIEVEVPRGRIFVAGSWDDSAHVSYQVRRDISGPRRDSLLVLPVFDGKMSLTYGAAGMQIRVIGADLPGDDGVDVRITVPRGLKLLRLTMRQAGEIAVEDFDGELLVKSTSGAVHLAYVNGPTLVEAGSGEITATVQSTIAHQPLSLLARDGDIRLTLAAGVGAEFDVDTRNGVIMSHPDLDGSIAASSILQLQPRDRNGPHHASGRFGLSGPLFRIVTLKGNVTLLQWPSAQGSMPRWIGNQ